jgi:hypothetical protein
MERIIRDKQVARSVEQGGKNPLFVLPCGKPAEEGIQGRKPLNAVRPFFVT